MAKNDFVKFQKIFFPPPLKVFLFFLFSGRDSTGNCRRACLRDTRTCVQMSDCLVSWMDRFCTIPAQAGIGNRQDDISTTVRSEAADAGAGENDGFVSDRRSNKIPACERTDADFLDMVSKGASKALLERDVLLSTDMPGLIVSIERAVKQELKVAVPKLQVSTTSKPTQCPIIPDSMSCSNLPDPCPVFPTSISCSNIANGRLHEDDIDRLKTHVESQTNPIKQDTADVKKLTEMVQNMNTNLLNFTSEPASEVFCSNLSDGSLSEEDLNQNFTESLKKVSEQLVELQTNMINVTDILLDFITKDEFSLNTNVSEVLETVQTLITQVNLKLDGGLEGVSKNVQEHDNSSSIRYDDVIDKVTKLNGGVAAIDTGLRDLGVVAERIIEKAKLLVTSSETRGDGQAESIRRVKQVGENVVEIKADLDELSEVAERIEEHAKILLEDTSSQIFFDTLTINLTDTVKDVVSGQFSTFKLSMDDWRNTIQTSIAATGSNYESLVRSHVKAIEVLKQSLPTGEYCEAGTLKITNSMGEIKTDILRHIDSAYAKQKVEIERDIKLLFGSMNESVDARISSADSGVEETDSLHRQDQHETNRYLRSAFLTQEQVLAETERRTEDALFKQMVGIKMEFGNLENIFRTKMATQSIMDGLDRRGELDDVVADLKLSMLQFSVLIANQNATESKRILTEQFKLNRGGRRCFQSVPFCFCLCFFCPF